jgi:acyl-CoA synthetase (AMP-forming)/AMP-acid ligase II
VTGRIKDVLIIRGRNHYPQDIEATAENSHPALLPAGSVALLVPGGENERPCLCMRFGASMWRRPTRSTLRLRFAGTSRDSTGSRSRGWYCSSREACREPPAARSGDAMSAAPAVRSHAGACRERARRAGVGHSRAHLPEKTRAVCLQAVGFCHVYPQGNAPAR